MATIGDTFVEASDTTLQLHTATGPNGGFGWTRVGGSVGHNIVVLAATDVAKADATSTLLRYRADSDLASDDHSSEVTVTAWGGASDNAGPAVRFDSAGDSFYVFIVRNNTSTTYRMFKVTAGTFAQLGSTVSAAAPGNGVVLRLEVNGDQLEGFANGVSVIGPITDASFSGQVRTGFLSAHNNTFDNFEAADLATGQNIPVGQATESETANPITPLISRTVAVGQTSEAETANAITPAAARMVDVGQAVEREIVRAVTSVIGRMVSIGTATEAETGQPISPVRGVAVGRATEVELARFISPIKPISVPIQTAVERELAQVITPTKAVPGQLGPAVCVVVSPSAECETFAL